MFKYCSTYEAMLIFVKNFGLKALLFHVDHIVYSSSSIATQA